MRAFITFICLLVISGCANGPVVGTSATNQPVADSSATDLERMVGQDVTLSGKFELAGIVGPYIIYNGKQVYLESQGSFSWGSDYERMQGKVVTINGVLHFRHFEPSDVQHPPDYFYFVAEKAKVGLK